METTGLLGQGKPNAATPTTIYTVGVGKQAQGEIMGCNQSATDDKVRVALVKSGEGLAAKHYVAYDVTIPANASFDGIYFDLNAGDSISVYSLNGTCSFTARGMEVS